MPIIRPFLHHHPKIHPSVFVAENSVIIGNVSIGEQSSVWYNVVMRGDVDAIVIGTRTNIQDGAILHCSTGLCPTIIGNYVTIGHAAVIHGCTVKDNSLIGMGAIVLDCAVVETNVMVAAGSVVLQNAVLESGWLYAGIPAKKVKPLSAEQIRALTESAIHYAENASIYKNP